LVENIKEMVRKTSNESDSFIVKNIQNVHHMKIDVVKFDDTKNFGCGVRGKECAEYAEFGGYS